MRRANYILAATLVMTALCADRAAAATPVAQREASQLAERLVSRISASFKRTVSTTRIYIARQQKSAALVCSTGRVTEVAVPTKCYSPSPFEFRLPPPVI